jgi:hypothetical protein
VDIQTLIVRLTELIDLLWPLGHPKDVVIALLDNSAGLLLKVWYGFILTTTDFETGADFIRNVTIQRFEPKVQIMCNVALALVTLWAAYRIMWDHGLRSQYTARTLLPRLMMGVVLINFALPLFQMAVDGSNALSQSAQTFVRLDDLSTFAANFRHDPNAGALEIITTAALAVAYDVLAITYLIRYAALVILAITAPLAGLLFMLPETHHLSKMWVAHFSTNLLMQPFQLFVLAIGFGLERNGVTPVHHLFALAALLIALKVPGALGGAEKAAHKLQSSVEGAFHHIEHALAKA